MAKRVQLIRHSTGGADAFTGLNGEITVDTTAKELRIHDSLTAGGIPTARKDLDNVANATVAIAGKMTAAQVVELTSATVAIAQEIIDRVADVDVEEARALVAESVLQGNVNTVAADLVTEEGVRASADTALNVLIAANAALIALKGNIDGQTFTNTTLTSPVINGSVTGDAGLDQTRWLAASDVIWIGSGVNFDTDYPITVIAPYLGKRFLIIQVGASNYSNPGSTEYFNAFPFGTLHSDWRGVPGLENRFTGQIIVPIDSIGRFLLRWDANTNINVTVRVVGYIA